MEQEYLAEFDRTGGDNLAKFISLILHPLLMPTYAFALIFFTKNYYSTFTPLNYKVALVGVTFLFTFMLPTINAFILLKMGRIKSLEMKTTAERVVPYGSTAVYYFALYYMFYERHLPGVLQIIILGAAISILLSLLINYRWKISAHTIGIGGIAGATLGIIYRLQLDFSFILMFVILLAGIVASARLKLKSHTPAQVYTGFLLGFAVEFLLMFFY